MNKPKKLIEVAMPIKEISAESVRDKSIRNGHISTLHLWWARRPLPVCRAIVFASLVPDPLDENCPQQFKEAVELLLGPNNDIPGDPYRPYEEIPHTAVVDKMEDNLRNRLLMFIGKFSNLFLENEKNGKKTPTKDQLSVFSLINWDSKNNEEIIGRARKLIYINHNSCKDKTTNELLEEFKILDAAVKNAEIELYTIKNRHLNSEKTKRLQELKDKAIQNFLSKMPKVFDPFAGGGAIPLEAARLGCNSYGNDINPVAHIVQKGSCEFPQKYGNPIVFSKSEFLKIYGEKELQKQILLGNIFGDEVNIANRLAFDVEYFCESVIEKTRIESNYLYIKDENGRLPIIYYWQHFGNCTNPTCKAEVPLIKRFYLSKRRGSSPRDWVYLNPKIEGKNITLEIKKGECKLTPWINRGNLTCPCCGNTTKISELKKQTKNNKTTEKIVALIYNSPDGKEFVVPSEELIKIEKDSDLMNRPTESLPVEYTQAFPISTWGYQTWGDLFNERQIQILNLFVKNINSIDLKYDLEYEKAIRTYLSMFLNRICMRYTKFNTWHIQQDTVEKIMGRQSISMVFDYPETNLFSDFTSAAAKQISQITSYIKEESKFPFSGVFNNAASGDINQFKKNEVNIVVTDPPYYDAIAYADISDFFYVWMKRTIGEIYPYNFAIPKTPKTEECTALKHHHNGSLQNANDHFESKLKSIFTSIEYQTSDIVTIMFAHQSTRAWTTLCNSILGANMNITGSWSVETEVTGGLKHKGDFLASSVTVSCIPSTRIGVGDYKEVQKEILHVIKKEVKLLYDLGFRGADLLTACFGKAVSVFGRYESVEKADGSEVIVAELLEMARDAAFDAIVSDIETDDLSKFYIGWLNLFGFSEAKHDDVRRVSQIGLSVEISDIYNQHILVKGGDKGVLGSMADRIKKDPRLGLRPVNNKDIDIAHRLMYMYDPNNSTRSDLLEYISEKAPTAESVVWRVLNSLAELLPQSKDMHDYKLAAGLLVNQDNLLREAKNRDKTAGVQGALDFNN